MTPGARQNSSTPGWRNRCMELAKALQESEAERVRLADALTTARRALGILGIPDVSPRHCLVSDGSDDYLVPLHRRQEALDLSDACERYWCEDERGKERLEREGKAVLELPDWMRRMSGRVLSFSDPREEP